MHIYKIPFTTNYFIDTNCKIYKTVNSALVIVKSIACNLYKINIRDHDTQMTIIEIIGLVKYGYTNLEIDFESDNMFESAIYHLSNLILRNEKSIYINDIEYRQSPKWEYLYSNKYGAIYDSRKNRFRKHTQDKDGYIRFSPDKYNTNYALHRFVYECWNNEILSKNDIIHHKDSNKANCYLDNFEKTSVFQNNRYSIINNERQLKLPINESDIHKMCQLMMAGKTYREIATEFGIDLSDDLAYHAFRSRLNNLLQHKSCWVDISSQYDFSNYTGNRDPNAKYTESDILEMYKLRQQGYLQKDIAEKFNTTPKYISEILCGRKRKSTFASFEEGSTTIESIP